MRRFVLTGVKAFFLGREVEFLLPAIGDAKVDTVDGGMCGCGCRR